MHIIRQDPYNCTHMSILSWLKIFNTLFLCNDCQNRLLPTVSCSQERKYCAHDIEERHWYICLPEESGNSHWGDGDRLGFTITERTHQRKHGWPETQPGFTRAKKIVSWWYIQNAKLLNNSQSPWHAIKHISFFFSNATCGALSLPLSPMTTWWRGGFPRPLWTQSCRPCDHGTEDNS